MANLLPGATCQHCALYDTGRCRLRFHAPGHPHTVEPADTRSVTKSVTSAPEVTAGVTPVTSGVTPVTTSVTLPEGQHCACCRYAYRPKTNAERQRAYRARLQAGT